MVERTDNIEKMLSEIKKSVDELVDLKVIIPSKLDQHLQSVSDKVGQLKPVNGSITKTALDNISDEIKQLRSENIKRDEGLEVLKTSAVSILKERPVCFAFQKWIFWRGRCQWGESPINIVRNQRK